MTQVVMVIMASDKQVKKSNKGLPFSSIWAKVIPKITENKDKYYLYTPVGTICKLQYTSVIVAPLGPAKNGHYYRWPL